MTNKEAMENLIFELEEEGHLRYIDKEINVAIKALEKQMPKKPIKGKDLSCIEDGYVIVFHCVNCHQYLSQIENYCPHCGQAIDWSKEE